MPPSASVSAPASASASARSSAAVALTSVSFHGSTGWIGGDGAIFGTRDAGATWRRVWTGPERVVTIGAVSATAAWAVLAPSSDPAAVRGALLRTADGGATWTRVALAQPVDLYPTGPLAAWAIRRSSDGAPGTLERTSDGGATWARVTTPSTLDGACAAGSLLWIASGRHVWLSPDTGATWAARDPEGLATDAPLRASLGCSGDAVWMLVTGGVGMSQQAYAVTLSLDRGERWRVVYTELQAARGALSAIPEGVDTIDAYSGPFSVVAPGVARFAGWCPACGAGTTSFVATDDAGATSVHAKVPDLDGTGAAAGMAFADANDGWIVSGDTHALVRTRDGGRTWSRVLLP